MRVLCARRTGIVVAVLLIAVSTAQRASGQSLYAVEWTNLVNASATQSALSKTSGCGSCADAGGTSLQALAAGDGYAEFVPVAGVRLYAGLGSSLTVSTDPALIDFAFSFWPDGGWDIRERNTYRAEGRFVAGDTFRVAVVAGVVTYYRNGALVYRSGAVPVYPLVLDTTLIGTGPSISAATITVPASPAPDPIVAPVNVTTTTLAGARVSQQYSTALVASGGTGTYLWTLAAATLPPGLSLSAGGILSGTPTSGGQYTMTVRVADAANASNVDDQVLSLTVFAASPPLVYDAIADRNPRPKPSLPALSGAGFIFRDPTFATRILRVTDGTTRSGASGASYRTPSGTHSNAWSVDGRYFYVTSTDGTGVPFSFDGTTMRAARLPAATGDGMTLRFFNEPTFSYVTPGVLYGTASGGNLRSIDQYDFASGAYTQLIDFDTLVPNLAGTYTGGLGASAGPVERIIAFFGGTSQDHHYYLVTFERQNPSSRHLLDTLASTVDGVPTNITLNFKIHAAAIDRSGRYVSVYPTSADLQAPRSAAPAYVWDLELNTFTATPLVSTRSGGHDAYGYGYRVNQDCCTSSTWDAAQWQIRSLATPTVTSDLIKPVLLPKEVSLADHPSWHQAQPVSLVPFLDATYRYGDNTTEWRAWDDEVIAVQTEAVGLGATVWRFAHHRSAVANDTDPTRISFWYTPRVNVSPDGRWALFTSNWENTLGTDPRGEAGGSFREDVFMVELARTAPASPISVLTTVLPAAQAGSPYSAQLIAAGGSGTYTWSVASGALPAGLSLTASTGALLGTPSTAGTAAFTVRAADAADATNVGDQALVLEVTAAPTDPVKITTTQLPQGTRDVPYNSSIGHTGGLEPLRWTVTAGMLPPGLALDAGTGTISGTPRDNGVWSFTIRVTDSALSPTSASQAFTIKIRRR